MTVLLINTVVLTKLLLTAVLTAASSSSSAAASSPSPSSIILDLEGDISDAMVLMTSENAFANPNPIVVSTKLPEAPRGGGILSCQQQLSSRACSQLPTARPRAHCRKTASHVCSPRSELPARLFHLQHERRCVEVVVAAMCEAGVTALAAFFADFIPDLAVVVTVLTKCSGGCEAHGLPECVVQEMQTQSRPQVCCRALPNSGREFGSWLSHVTESYSHLAPATLFFPFDKDLRRLGHAVNFLLAAKRERTCAEGGGLVPRSFACQSDGLLMSQETFTLPEVPEKFRARHRPLRNFVSSSLYATWERAAQVPVCWKGVFLASRSSLLLRSRESYASLLRETEQDVMLKPGGEVGHFLERTAAMTFAADVEWLENRCTFTEQTVDFREMYTVWCHSY